MPVTHHQVYSDHQDRHQHASIYSWSDNHHRCTYGECLARRRDNTPFPGTNPSFPGTNPSFPGTNPPFPGTNPSFPGTNPSFPSTNPSARPQQYYKPADQMIVPPPYYDQYHEPGVAITTVLYGHAYLPTPPYTGSIRYRQATPTNYCKPDHCQAPPPPYTELRHAYNEPYPTPRMEFVRAPMGYGRPTANGAPNVAPLPDSVPYKVSDLMKVTACVCVIHCVCVI